MFLLTIKPFYPPVNIYIDMEKPLFQDHFPNEETLMGFATSFCKFTQRL